MANLMTNLAKGLQELTGTCSNRVIAAEADKIVGLERTRKQNRCRCLDRGPKQCRERGNQSLDSFFTEACTCRIDLIY